MKSSRPTIESLRQAWGRDVARERDMATIALYEEFVAGRSQSVDEQTWQDLGMDQVFAAIDRTTSMPGRQMLYARMRREEVDPVTLSERARQYAAFRQDAKSREEIQLQLSRLDQPGAQFLGPFLVGRSPVVPPLSWIFYILGAIPLACLIGMLWIKALFLAVILAVLVNTVVYLTYGQKIARYFAGFAQIDVMLGVAAALSKSADPHQLPELRILRKETPARKRVQRGMGWLVIDRTSMPELMQGAFLYLNMFFLLDVVVFLRSRRALEEERGPLGRIFESIGALDVAIAVASFLESQAVCCIPTFAEDHSLRVVDLIHPSIPGAVPNSVQLEGRSAAIAGPNMAGKTTFIRAVGINLLLGQTLNFCLAREAVFPRAKVRSSIRREDDLAEGESYFFTEIKRVLEFVNSSPDARFVFLLDEIFRGTNTQERIACSVAVLGHLARSQTVLVTTHDAELQELLKARFDMFHFSDQVVAEKYGFDYRIRPGPAHSRNAIKLLALSGYPASIVSEALAVADRLKPTSG